MLEKQQLRMHLDNDYLIRHSYLDHPVFAVFRDSDEDRSFDMMYKDWVDMGSPNVITLTVEPGDKLNTPPLDLSGPLTPNEIKDMYK